MDRQMIYEEIDEIAREICVRYSVHSIALPDKVLDWITDVFMDDYLDTDENRLPNTEDVIKGICNYLIEET